MVYVVNGVLASGVDMLLEKDLVGFALQEMKIHPLMLLTLSMIFQTFSPTLHNPSTRHTRVNYVGTILIMAANISTHTPEPSRRFNSFYDDDDYEESIIPLNEIVSQIPPSIAITPVLPTLEPEDSLSMGDEHLSTIPEKESDEVIKSSVEDLVPIPSESEDTSESDSDCDLPSCDDFSPINNIESKDSYVSNLDEPALLVTPLFDANEDECFDPGGEIDEIDTFLDMDISTDIENSYHDSEGDIIYLESLLINDTIPNLPPKVFLDHDPKNLKDEPNNEDLKSMDKVFDPGIHENFFFPTYVSLPFEDRHYLSFTYVIRIFLPYFTYPVDSSLPLSSRSEDIIFDPDIFAYSFYSLETVAYKCPMEVFSSTCFVPNITMIWGDSS
ncbi:hypothetical protein Tco_0515024 [Tanacetum coccineum]